MGDLISIIIPIYNRKKLVVETLDSIRAQTYTNWECIVVDDHSTDGTLDVLTAYEVQDSRFKIYKRPTERIKGASACRNFGFENSQGEYVVYFDSDDLMHKEYINKQYENCLKHKALFSICKFTTFNNTGNTLLRESILYKQNLLEDFITKKIKVNTPTLFLNRRVIEDIQYDPTLVKAQDLDFIYRIFLKYAAMGCVLEEVLVQVRIHENRITASYKNFELQPLLSSIEVKWRILKATYGKVDAKSYQEVKSIFISELKLILFRGNFRTFFQYLNKAQGKGYISTSAYFSISFGFGLQSLYKIPKGLLKRSTKVKLWKRSLTKFLKNDT